MKNNLLLKHIWARSTLPTRKSDDVIKFTFMQYIYLLPLVAHKEKHKISYFMMNYICLTKILGQIESPTKK